MFTSRFRFALKPDAMVCAEKQFADGFSVVQSVEPELSIFFQSFFIEIMNSTMTSGERESSTIVAKILEKEIGTKFDIMPDATQLFDE